MIPDIEEKILARTMYGEARNQGWKGMEAVALVILNRLAVSKQKKIYWWGNSIEEICLSPSQFTCWKYDDANRKRISVATIEDEIFEIALEIAEDAVSGLLIHDRTNGATHYYNPAAVQFSPAWAIGESPLVIIGDHHFYRPREVPKLISADAGIKPKKRPSLFGWIWNLFFK